MTKIIIVVILLLYTTTLTGTENEPVPGATVSGIILCEGELIPFVNVLIEGTSIGTSSNSKGTFELKSLPPGNHTIIARGIGYRQNQQTIQLKAGDFKELVFELKEDVLHLESVVVTADRNAVTRAEAPLIINTLSSKLFEKTQATSIADGLDFTPGLRMENNCQNCGFSQVRMNGLEGPYSQILINNRPIFSGLAGVYGLELIPTGMVDRIEVVRGGGSALFGGNAIAGTINIITREPRRNTFEINSSLGILGNGNNLLNTPSLDRILNLNASVVDEQSGLFVYALARERDPYDINNDGFSETVLMENTTVGFNVYYQPGDKSKLLLDYYRIAEFRRGGNKFDYLPHEADITEQVDHLINGASLSYDLYTHQSRYNKLSVYASAQTVDRSSYYGAQQDPSAYGQTSDLSASVGSQYTMHFDQLLIAPSVLIAGIDNTLNTLKDTKLGSNGQKNSLITNQLVNTIGTFAQNDWNLGRAKLSLGLRYDHYHISDRNAVDNKPLTGNVIAPRTTLLLQLSPSAQLRASYAKGYRAPQLFDEDLHIEASGAKRVLHSNSPDLKQESSHSFTASFNTNFSAGNKSVEFLAEGFFTQLKDPFSNEYRQLDNNGTFEYMRINANDGAHVAGTNLELNTVFNKVVMAQLGYTIQQALYDSPQSWGESDESITRHFVRTPNQYGFATLEYLGIEHLSLSFTGTYTGTMLIPHFGLDPNTSDPAELEAIGRGDVIRGERLETSEHFFLIGGKISYCIELAGNTDMELGLGIQNIFNQNQKEHDRGVFRDAGYMYGPGKPRTIAFSIKIGNALH